MAVHEIPIQWWTAVTTYMGYALLIMFGRVREWLAWLWSPARRPPAGYAPLVADWEDFYQRRLYHRIQDCWNRPVASCPGAWMDVVERTPMVYGQPLRPTGNLQRCLNMGSYNYLGFGDPDSPTRDTVLATLERFGVATTSTRSALGTTTVHRELERTVARFVRKEDAMIFGMGFATNSVGIPTLVGRGGLIISDSCNHSSIVVGARTSGATIRVFGHNDPEDLERVVRRAIVEGQPRTHRPWKKILIMVEGIYSMEGELCPLKEIIAIKKKYKCYLYVDEAHSIGAIGATGRGITEHAKVNPADVDILMGTFTKSFGAVGGYLAASKEIVGFLRANSPGALYSASISTPAAQQVVSAMRIIMGEECGDLGQRKLTQLRENSNFFRKRVQQIGLQSVGDWDSPIVPVMLYNPAKIAAFSRRCLARNLAVVVVGYPAAPLLFSRSRFCISAAHTREDLEEAAKVLEEVAIEIGCGFPYPRSSALPALTEAHPGLRERPKAIAAPDAHANGNGNGYGHAADADADVKRA